MIIIINNNNQKKPNIMKNNQFFKKEALAKGIVRGVLSLSVASMLLFTSCSKDEVNAEAPIEQNNAVLNSASTGRTGTSPSANGSYFYTIDADQSSSGFNITFPAGRGKFYMTWGGIRQVVGGLGWRNTVRRTVNYNIGSLSGNDVKFAGVYGWTQSPLTEYYVCERGPGAIFAPQRAGNNYTVNGHSYAMTKAQRVNKPSVNGTATFWQVQGRWGGAALNTNYAVDMNAHINNFRGALGGSFGLGLVDARNYMVFGCEAYNYSTLSQSGSMNATIW
jgi:endo-1,4-beta-xylanase